LYVNTKIILKMKDNTLIGYNSTSEVLNLLPKDDSSVGIVRLRTKGHGVHSTVEDDSSVGIVRLRTKGHGVHSTVEDDVSGLYSVQDRLMNKCGGVGVMKAYPIATPSTTNPTWSDLVLMPRHCGGKLATDHPSRGPLLHVSAPRTCTWHLMTSAWCSCVYFAFIWILKYCVAVISGPVWDGLAYGHRGPESRGRRLVSVGWEYNRAAISLIDITTETLSSRLGVERRTGNLALWESHKWKPDEMRLNLPRKVMAEWGLFCQCRWWLISLEYVISLEVCCYRRDCNKGKLVC
jgi:hypothetical protein